MCIDRHTYLEHQVVNKMLSLKISVYRSCDRAITEALSQFILMCACVFERHFVLLVCGCVCLQVNTILYKSVCIWLYS